MQNFEREELLGDMILLAGGDSFRPRFEKFLDRLHPDLIRSEMSEVRIRVRAGRCAHPGKLLTHFLNVQMARLGVKKEPPKPKQIEKKSHLAPNLPTLLSELPNREPTPEERDLVEGGGRNIYGRDFTPWPAMMGPEWFKQPGEIIEKDKSGIRRDRVMVPFKTGDGNTVMVPMVRGSKFAADREEWKVLDTDDYGVMLALAEFWRMQGGQTYDNKRTGKKLAYCQFEVNNLARALGYKTKGRSLGSSRLKLASQVGGLEKARNYFDFRGVKGMEEFVAEELSKSIAFILDANVTSAKIRGRGHKLFMRVTFSEFFTSQLLSGWCVSRSLNLARLRDPLTVKLSLVLQKLPRTGPLRQMSFSELIKLMSLRTAKWHKLKFQRGRFIGGAINDLNGEAVDKRLAFDLKIFDRPDDFYLQPGFRFATAPVAARAEEEKIRELVLRDSADNTYFSVAQVHAFAQLASALATVAALKTAAGRNAQ